jgi:hypothetical protein
VTAVFVQRFHEKAVTFFAIRRMDQPSIIEPAGDLTGYEICASMTRSAMRKAFEPLIVAQQGRIGNIGSVSGILASPNLPRTK